jgi:hypothetical protein
MQRRVVHGGLLILGLAAFYVLFLHREAREGASGDHLIVRFELGGKVLLGSPPVLVATLPESRSDARGAWRDAFNVYRRAVIARFAVQEEDVERGDPDTQQHQWKNLSLHRTPDHG